MGFKITKKVKIVSVVFVLFCTTIVNSGCVGKKIYQTEVSEKQAEIALNIAIEQIEKPYVWGGRGPNEFDCSGLITWSYKKAIGQEDIFKVGNYKVNDVTMNDLYTWNVNLVSLEKIKPGDIVFITNEEKTVTHGGMFISWVDNTTFQFINSSSYHGKVMIDTWPLDKTKRGQWFIGAGRLKRSY